MSDFWKDKVRIILPLVILAVGVAGFVAFGKRPPVAVRDDGSRPAPLVETTTIRQHNGPLSIDTDGLAAPYREIDVATEVAGRILHKAQDCRPGRYVTKGTVLIQIDPEQYSLEVQRLQSQLQQSDVSIEETDVEIANTGTLIALAEEEQSLQQRQLQRTLDLKQRGAATDADVDRAKRDEVNARNAVTTLRNQSHLLKTRRGRLVKSRQYVALQLERAQLDLRRTEIAAPIDGVIVQDTAEQDGYVDKGKVLFTVEDTSRVEVRCALRMEELAWLWDRTAPYSEAGAQDPRRNYELPPTPATVVYELAGNKYSWEGVLSRYEGLGLDERTRTVPCRVLVDRPWEMSINGSAPAGYGAPPALVRGMYVQIKIDVEPKAPLLKLPQRAIRPGRTVWTVADGRIVIKSAKVATLVDDGVLVFAGASDLAAGDSVVVSPLASVFQGMQVREHSPQ